MSRDPSHFPLAALAPSTKSLPWGLCPRHTLFYCMGRNFLLRQLPESISKIPQLVFNVWFAVTTAQSGMNPLEEFVLDNHDGMGQVRLLVGSCGRHAMTTGPTLTHTVATQGTHFHHMEMAASVNHNVRELCRRTVTLPRRAHLAGGPKRSIHATQGAPSAASTPMGSVCTCP